MQYIGLLLIVALVFGVCFLVDKGFSKAFRSRQQHKSGKAVRLNKRYAAMGIVILVLGVAAIATGIQQQWLLLVAGCVMLLLGGGLVVYYVSFGIYYDEDTFLLERFGKPGVTYRFKEIQYQQLYAASGHVMVELILTDERVVQLQSGMDGMYPFMDFAFHAWLRQKGLKEEDCPYYDPKSFCWFPVQEDE